MATKHFCDRCPRPIESYTISGNNIKVPFPDHKYDTRKTQANDFTAVDLCDTCIRELRAFLGLEEVQRIEE